MIAEVPASSAESFSMDWDTSTHASKNFSYAALCKSETAERLGLDNTPSPAERASLIRMARFLEYTLKTCGDFFLASCFRAWIVHNKIPGASKKSDHPHACAADMDNFKVGNWVAAKRLIDVAEAMKWFWKKGTFRENYGTIPPIDQLILYEEISENSKTAGRIHCGVARVDEDTGEVKPPRFEIKIAKIIGEKRRYLVHSPKNARRFFGMEEI